MNIKNYLAIALTTIPLLTCPTIFAAEPDWQKQNADLSAQQANTANVNAETANIKANTAAQNATTNSQNANTASQTANTATQNAETAAQNANTAAQIADTAAQNANTDAQTANTAAQNAQTMRKIVTPVPAPKEISNAPSGFISCDIVEAAWYNGMWIPQHRVCKYNPTPEGVAWVEGYWTCTKQQRIDNNADMCITWDWKPGHWVKTLQEY